MRIMYDATNVNAIPGDALMVAGYVDGIYQTVPALRQRFPHAQVVTITVLGRPGANVCDCESGDLTAAEAAQWARSEKQAGRHPTIYCSQSPWPQVMTECRVAGLNPAKDVSWWITAYNPDHGLPVQDGVHAVAHQHTGNQQTPGGLLDISSVAAFWPGVDKPLPAHHCPIGSGWVLGPCVLNDGTRFEGGCADLHNIPPTAHVEGHQWKQPIGWVKA